MPTRPWQTHVSLTLQDSAKAGARQTAGVTRATAKETVDFSQFIKELAKLKHNRWLKARLAGSLRLKNCAEFLLKSQQTRHLFAVKSCEKHSDIARPVKNGVWPWPFTKNSRWAANLVS